MIIMAIDSSSACTGIVVAEINNKSLSKIGSCPIIPAKINVEQLGYKKTKKKFTTKDGTKTYSSYHTGNEDHVSEAEAKRRNVQVRQFTNSHKMRNIGGQLNNLLTQLKPDMILIERNKIFNSVLTSTLLAEVMGLVEGVASANGIQVNKYTVEQVRKAINSAKLVKDFTKHKTPSQLASMKDVTKEAIKEYMVSIYGDKGFNPTTLDEGDACLIFHYWFENEYK